jgi:formamidopyrimidine-DNA glycosylase
MPELPDVEVFRRQVARSSLHRRIARVRVLDEYVVRGRSGRSLASRLRGTSLEKASRHGKQMFVELSNGSHLVAHFGMTGYVSTDDPPPRFTRVLLEFDTGRPLAFVDARKLGFLAVVDDLAEHCRRSELGPDALTVSPQDLRALCSGWRGGVKALLMEQEALAGIGNIYSDEILFQARIHPRRRADQLPAAEVRRLHRQLQRVLETAIERRADPERLPSGWLLRHREDGAQCPRGNGVLERITVVGRSSYVCSTCQPFVSS